MIARQENEPSTKHEVSRLVKLVGGVFTTALILYLISAGSNNREQNNITPKGVLPVPATEPTIGDAPTPSLPDTYPVPTYMSPTTE